MEKPRLLKRNTESTTSYSSAPAGGSIDTMTAACIRINECWNKFS